MFPRDISILMKFCQIKLFSNPAFGFPPAHILARSRRMLRSLSILLRPTAYLTNTAIL